MKKDQTANPQSVVEFLESGDLPEENGAGLVVEVRSGRVRSQGTKNAYGESKGKIVETYRLKFATMIINVN